MYIKLFQVHCNFYLNPNGSCVIGVPMVSLRNRFMGAITCSVLDSPLRVADKTPQLFPI